MALTQKDLEYLGQFTSITPQDKAGVLSPEADLAETRALRASRREKTQSKGYIADTIQQTKDIGSDIKESLTKRGQNISETQTAFEKGDQGLLRSAFQKFGQVAGGVSDVIGSTVMGGIKAITPEFIQKPAGELVQAGVENLMETDLAQNIAQKYQSLDEKTKRDIDSLLGIGSLATDVVGVGLAKKPVTTAVKKGFETAVDIAKATPRITQKLVGVTKEAVKPSVSVEQAVKETLQGKKLKPEQIAEKVETLKSVDTSKVKTFDDLDNVIDSKIEELSKKVDVDLSTDPTRYAPEQLIVSKTSKGGQSVQQEFVQDALAQLDELYGTTGDAVQQANIKELIDLSKTQGLTRQEVNDIARTYGQEFKQKAFSKLGDPLTSVNAQRFENTRSGLKEVARAGVKGKQAALADKQISRLYNIQKLVKKNIEAVNTLQSKIEKRGLVEKVGYILSKYADIFSGGAIRGFIGGVLPRGVGNKTLNALDLEELLQRNLGVIKDAGKAKTAKQFESTLKKLKEPLNKKEALKQTGKATIGATLISE